MYSKEHHSWDVSSPVLFVSSSGYCCQEPGGVPQWASYLKWYRQWLMRCTNCPVCERKLCYRLSFVCLFVCLFVCSSFGRSAAHLTSHVTGTPPWRCLAVQSSSGTSQRVSAGTRGTRARRRRGRMSGTTTPCCTPCSSWPSCSETCWCVWPCWGSALCRPPPTTWWSAWLWPTCWWRHWSCPGLCTWRWGVYLHLREHWSITMSPNLCFFVVFFVLRECLFVICLDCWGQFCGSGRLSKQ